MPDYKLLYTALFKKVSGAIEILQEAQCEMEELFLQDAQGNSEDSQPQEPQT